MTVFNSDVNLCHARASLLPKVGHAVESRLLVEDVAPCIHNNSAVHKVFNPVWPTSLVQCQVPVCPTHNVIIQVLKKRIKRREGNIVILQDLFCVNGCVQLGVWEFHTST